LYKILGISLLGIAAIMMIPAAMPEQVDQKMFSGFATVSLVDADKNVLFEQTIHNNVVDTGEDFIIDQAFKDLGTDVADAAQFNTICVTNATSVSTGETETASTFNTANGLTSNNCIGAITFTTTAGIASSGAQTFSETTHFPAGTTVTGIGVCADGAQGTPFNNCDLGTTPLLAVVDTSNVTVNAGESVDITYSFDISA